MQVAGQRLETLQDDQDFGLDGSGDGSYTNTHNLPTHGHNHPSSPEKHNRSRNFDDYYANKTSTNANQRRTDDKEIIVGKPTNKKTSKDDRGKKISDNSLLDTDNMTSYDDEDYNDVGSGDNGEYVDENYDDYNTDYNTEDSAVVGNVPSTTTTATTTTTTTTPLPTTTKTTTEATTTTSPTSILEENGIYSVADDKRRNGDDRRPSPGDDDESYPYEGEYGGEYDDGDEYYDGGTVSNDTDHVNGHGTGHVNGHDTGHLSAKPDHVDMSEHDMEGSGSIGFSDDEDHVIVPGHHDREHDTIIDRDMDQDEDHVNLIDHADHEVAKEHEDPITFAVPGESGQLRYCYPPGGQWVDNRCRVGLGNSSTASWNTNPGDGRPELLGCWDFYFVPTGVLSMYSLYSCYLFPVCLCLISLLLRMGSTFPVATLNGTGCFRCPGIYMFW